MGWRRCRRHQKCYPEPSPRNPDFPLPPSSTVKCPEVHDLMRESPEHLPRDFQALSREPCAGGDTSGDAIQDEVVLQLQLQQFQLARSAIMTDFGCEKDVTTNPLSVSATGLASILRKIASFRSEILSIVHKDEHSPDRVYQLCLAFFPLSRRTP